MNCPHCHDEQTTSLNWTTDLGYQMYRCQECKRYFNERTGTPLQNLGTKTDSLVQHRHDYATNLPDKKAVRLCPEKTSPFNFLPVPTDIVFQVLLCRLRYMPEPAGDSRILPTARL